LNKDKYEASQTIIISDDYGKQLINNLKSPDRKIRDTSWSILVKRGSDDESMASLFYEATPQIEDIYLVYSRLHNNFELDEDALMNPFAPVLSREEGWTEDRLAVALAALNDQSPQVRMNVAIIFGRIGRNIGNILRGW
jgi:hypothetical protein